MDRFDVRSVFERDFLYVDEMRRMVWAENFMLIYKEAMSHPTGLDAWKAQNPERAQVFMNAALAAEELNHHDNA